MGFDGRTIYDSDGAFFNTAAEDVAPLIKNISPRETLYLDALPKPQYPLSEVENVKTIWVEDALNPTSLANKTAIGSEVGPTSFQLRLDSLGDRLLPGHVLLAPKGERMMIMATRGNTVTVNRGIAGTATKITTVAPNTTMQIIQYGSVDGATVTTDISPPRKMRDNWVKPYFIPVLTADNMNAVRMKGEQEGGLWHKQQEVNRLAEMLVMFERDVLRGISLGNTLGGGTVDKARMFNGVIRQIELEDITIGGGAPSGTLIGTLAGQTLTTSSVNNWLRQPYTSGKPADIIICDALLKEEFNALNNTTNFVLPSEQMDIAGREVSFFRSDYAAGGRAKILMCRAMPPYSMLIQSVDQTEVVPLRGFSFQIERYPAQGRQILSAIKGDYTVRHWTPQASCFVTKGDFVY